MISGLFRSNMYIMWSIFKNIEFYCFQIYKTASKSLSERAIRKVTISSLWESYFPPIINNFWKKIFSIKSHNGGKSVRIRSYSGPYPVRMRENTNQNNSEYVHFSRRHIIVLQDFVKNFFQWHPSWEIIKTVDFDRSSHRRC